MFIFFIRFRFSGGTKFWGSKWNLLAYMVHVVMEDRVDLLVNAIQDL